MKNKILSLLAFTSLLIGLTLSGCYYDEVVPEVIDPGNEISFSGDLIPIFNASCNTAGCHSPGAVAPDLTAANAFNALVNGSYIDVGNPEASELYQWVKGNRAISMPLSGEDPVISSSVLIWIQQGALNN